MNAIIGAVKDEIQHLKKNIENNDCEIYDRVNANALMKGRINQLQYELDKLMRQLPQDNIGMSANCNGFPDDSLKCVTPNPNGASRY